MPSDPTSSSRGKSSAGPEERGAWKERYATLKARAATAKLRLRSAQQALQQTSRRMRRYERQVLRHEVLSDLMPARARYRRETGADDAARCREATHASVCATYAAARALEAPAGADRVEIGGVTWWVPADSRAAGRLADRVLHGDLRLNHILRTREGISNGTMLDIGANMGLTSVTRAILGDAAVVYAAEPAPENFACLVRTVIDNGLQGTVLPDCVAISDRDGTARLRIAASSGGHALREDAEGIEVPTLRLDSWVKRLGIDVRGICYVKSDTQGHESQVLAGAPELLACTGIVWEIEFAPSFQPKRDPATLVAQMQAAFTYFIDLNASAGGRRRRAIAELPEAVAYLDRGFTNLLLYHV